MKAKLRAEIQFVGDMRVKIEPVAFMNMDPPNRNDVDKTVKDLFADCNKYCKIHTPN